MSGLGQQGTPAATATAEILDFCIRGNDTQSTAAVHDALCMAYAVDPSAVRVEHLNVQADTVGFHSYGRTIVDLKGVSGRAPDAFVALYTDATKLYGLLNSPVTRTPEFSTK